MIRQIEASNQAKNHPVSVMLGLGLEAPIKDETEAPGRVKREGADSEQSIGRRSKRKCHKPQKAEAFIVEDSSAECSDGDYEGSDRSNDEDEEDDEEEADNDGVAS